MDRNIFLICGYGIPKDISTDKNYQIYLNTVFNTIFESTQKHNVKNPAIIFTGGSTDCFTPYTRTEADEMLRAFKTLALRSYTTSATKQWKYITEKKSLSTLENFVFSKQILEKKKISNGIVTIFCEHTRKLRVKKLAHKILHGYQLKFVAVDFDTSSHRFDDPQIILDRENQVLHQSLWALKSKENFKKYHNLFEEKMKFLRTQGPTKHSEALSEWWKTKVKEFEKEIKNSRSYK